jgi:hypothetical protein
MLAPPAHGITSKTSMGSQMDIDKPHALKSGQLGDAAWDDILCLHPLEVMPVDLALPQRIGADQEAHALTA